jgi:hypothetical protein
MVKKINKSTINDDTIIKFNIGGQKFVTTGETIHKENNTFFTAIFSEQFNCKPNLGDYYFIDRDPTYFHYILNYLRDPTTVEDQVNDIVKRHSPFELSKIEEEVNFYGVVGLLDELNRVTAHPAKSGLIVYMEGSQLDAWIGKKGNWNLLYQATRDGFGSGDFHKSCDNKGPTVTIIKTTNGSFLVDIVLEIGCQRYRGSGITGKTSYFP